MNRGRKTAVAVQAGTISTRQRSEFVRQAIRNAVRQGEYRAIREAYRKQPDSISDADDWSTVEEYKP